MALRAVGVVGRFKPRALEVHVECGAGLALDVEPEHEPSKAFLRQPPTAHRLARSPISRRPSSRYGRR